MTSAPRGLRALRRDAAPLETAITVNQIIKGKLNATVDVTLSPNASSTTLSDTRITPYSFIGLMPQTANAFDEWHDGIWITNRTIGSCVINHAQSANTDMTFTVLIIG